MTPDTRHLTPALRKQLERTVIQARDVAEAGARAALEALAVPHHEPYGHMSSEQRTLRRRLRAHARQLGDRANSPLPLGEGPGVRVGSHGIDHLVQECAYEHWHGMLFARFLAENDLLIEPDMSVAISLDECEELAKEEGIDKWALAARFAHHMLPQVFRPDHPVFEIQFAREHRLKLEGLVEDLPPDVFTATDSLGWVYQFWQTRKKAEVNRSEVKIGADELPAVTQLFTEPYMVQFLLHNSLGSWWVSRHPDKPCPVKLTYLRYAPSPEGGVGNSPLPLGEGLGVRVKRLPADLLQYARELRRNQTDAEQLLWGLLRSRRFLNKKFRRQYPVERYILDFYCHESKLAIELDGGQHNEPYAVVADGKRTRDLAEKEIRVLRFWNNDVLQNTESVLEAIYGALTETPSPQTPLPGGEGPPAAGTFDGWPDDLSEFRLLDPCCGSGHFLVAAFLMLVPMRMELENLSAAEAVDAVLRDNLHGLELDQRCVAIAVFALALEAWRYPNLPSPSGRGVGGEALFPSPLGRGVRGEGNYDPLGYRSLPSLNLAWCGQPVAGKREQWLALAAGDSRLEAGMAALYDTFRDAPLLGSLIDPTQSVSEDLLTAGFAELEPLLESALREYAGGEERAETAIAAQGLAEAARLLGDHYHLVITNVPYLTRGKQNERLRKFCEARYPKAKNDLANVFLERCLGFSWPEGVGVTQIVMPQNWLFLTSYKAQREHLLKETRWELLVRLGEGGFDSTQAAGAFTILLTLTRTDSDAEHRLHGIDASAPRTAAGKVEVLREGEVAAVGQQGQLENPDVRIVLEESIQGVLLEKYTLAPNGMHGGDFPRFRLFFWEVLFRNPTWRCFQTAVDETVLYGGREHIFFWPDEGRIYDENPNARIQGSAVWGRQGVVIRVMRNLPATLYAGDLFDISCVPIVPVSPEYLAPIWCFCSSPDYNDAVRKIDQKLNVTNATLAKVPFDFTRWQEVAAERYPNSLPKPYSDDPTQWVFHGHPGGSVVWEEAKKWTAHGPLRTDATVLQAAVARLLGYRWPAESTLTPGPSPGGRGENNPSPSGRRWPEGPDEGSMELADEQREWVEKAKTLYPFEDEDGIVCISSMRGERPAHERLLHLLEAAYSPHPDPLPGGEGGWNDGVLANLFAEAGGQSLDDWLRNKFFEQHCKLFHHRPFIWHIWDGRKRDGFHALVNYHKLAEGDGKGRRILESLTYSYLGDWISRQEDGVKRGEGGAEDRLAAALELQKRLVAIIEGEPPFDIFVRWKPIEEQPIGWEPDINDGVRLNIRPFMAQDIPGGKKGAGILRAKPNVHWKKDRGKEPMREQDQFPWFWNAGKFTGERINDVHLTNAEKRKARNRAEGKQ